MTWGVIRQVNAIDDTLWGRESHVKKVEIGLAVCDKRIGMPDARNGQASQKIQYTINRTTYLWTELSFLKYCSFYSNYTDVTANYGLPHLRSGAVGKFRLLYDS